jgi:hypothetical protein
MNPSELTITDLVSAIRYAQEEHRKLADAEAMGNRVAMMQGIRFTRNPDTDFWEQRIAHFQSILRTKLQEIK